VTLPGPGPRMPIDIAVVPVAGLGTRLLPATGSQPKERLPVGHKPVVQCVVGEFALAGPRAVPGLRARLERRSDVPQA
jgi:UTP--glucose-1-phosphate uridylyltransferase